jgi:AcrR family transcriptional regulator
MTSPATPADGRTPTRSPARAVPRSPARDRILDAFALLLIDQGERAATLDAVAATAGLSKGGLLYHFGSKDALVNGLLDRLSTLVAADVQDIRSAPAGAVDYLIRTSMSEGTPLDQGIRRPTRRSLTSGASGWP